MRSILWSPLPTTYTERQGLLCQILSDKGKYADKRLLSTQKVTSSGIFWSKIFILLRVYGWKLRGWSVLQRSRPMKLLTTGHATGAAIIGNSPKHFPPILPWEILFLLLIFHRHRHLHGSKMRTKSLRIWQKASMPEVRKTTSIACRNWPLNGSWPILCL